MSSSESDVSACVSESSGSSEYLFGSQYLLYQGEPLAPQGENITDKHSKETSKKADLDGLTPAMWVARYDQNNKVDSWYVQ